MTDEGVVVLGIPIPSSSPMFLSIVAVHVAAGLVCTIAGIAAMLTPKRAGRHPAAGTVYYWSLVVVFLSMAALSILRWPHNTHLFVLGILSLPLERSDARQDGSSGAAGSDCTSRAWRSHTSCCSQRSMSTMDRTSRCGDRCHPSCIGSCPVSLAFLFWSGH